MINYELVLAVFFERMRRIHDHVPNFHFGLVRSVGKYCRDYEPSEENLANVLSLYERVYDRYPLEKELGVKVQVMRELIEEDSDPVTKNYCRKEISEVIKEWQNSVAVTNDILLDCIKLMMTGKK